MTVEERGLAAGAGLCEVAARRVDPDAMLLDLQRASQRRSHRTLTAIAVALVLVVATILATGLGHPGTTPSTAEHSAPKMRAVHHNGSIAVGLPDGSLVDPVTGAVNHSLLGCQRGSALSWSPDGLQLAFTTNNELRVCTTGPDGLTRTLTAVHGQDWYPLAWSPDGTTIARGSTAGIDIYSPTDGHLLRTLALGSGIGVPWSLSWSPDESALVFPAADHGAKALFVINSDGSGLHKITGAVAEGEDGPISASWSPDGARIAYLEGGPISSALLRESVMLIDPDGTGRVRIADAGQARDKQTVPNLTWSPDGRRLAVVGYAIDGSPEWELFVMSPDGGQRTRLVTGVLDPDAAWQPVP